MSETPNVVEVLHKEILQLHGESIAFQTILCSVLAHIGTLHPELAKAIKSGFSEAGENMTRQVSLKYDKAPEYVTHAIQLIEEMRAAALDGV